VLHPNWALQIASFLAPLTLGYAAVQAFVLVTLQQVRTSRLSFSKQHVVVCGLGRKGLQLVRDFRDPGPRRNTVVAIDADEDNDRLRICRELGAVVLVGDASNMDLLRQARVAAASLVVATTEDDGVNVEIAMQAHKLFRERPGSCTHKLRCLVHVVDPTLVTLFKEAPMIRSGTGLFDARVFNIFEDCARLLFEENPLDRVPIGKDSRLTVHLVVVGFGKMGQGVALQAARIGHFANGCPLRITVVDKKADEVRAGFLSLYPQFGAVCDLGFVQTMASSGEFGGMLVNWAEEPNTLLTVAVCLDNDSRSLTRALGLADKLKDHDVPVLARMEEDVGLASLLKCKEAGHASVRLVTAFGQINRACAIKRLLSERQDRIARRVHEDYLTVARADPNKRDDDEALRDWDDLPESYKDANRHVADHADVKLRAIGLPAGKAPAREFTADEIEVLSRMEHARWKTGRLLAGWRHAPPPKDERHKTNPNIVPWEELDEPNREKDRKAVCGLLRWYMPHGEET